MTGITYTVIEIFTSEEARWKGVPLYEAVVRAVAREKTAARCIVTRAVAGCFENGEMASHRVLDLSHNMPLKIEIVLPAPEADVILAELDAMVTEGIVLVKENEVRSHRTTGGLLSRGLLVRDVMTASPVSVAADAPLREVVAVLVRSEFDGVPVVGRSGRLAGMVTQEALASTAGLPVGTGLLAAIRHGADTGVKSGAERPDVDSRGLTAGDIMTAGPAAIAPDIPLARAVKQMVRENLKRLPVVDADRHLVGMLARIDILRVASTGSSRRKVLRRYGVTVAPVTRVGQASLMEVPVVSPDTEAALLLDLIDNEGQRVVVVDGSGCPLGVVSDRDLLPLLDSKGGERGRGLTAGSIMRDVPTISEDASVEDALDWMVAHRRKRLPVVDAAGGYVGMLGREELLRILAPDVDA